MPMTAACNQASPILVITLLGDAIARAAKKCNDCMNWINRMSTIMQAGIYYHDSYRNVHCVLTRF